MELEVSKALAKRLVLLLGYSYLMFPPGKSGLQTGVPRRPLGSAHRQVEVGRVEEGKAVAKRPQEDPPLGQPPRGEGEVEGV